MKPAPLAHLALSLGALLLCALPAPAHADDPVVEANRHYQLGVDLYKERRFDGALVEFERANALAPHPLTRLNLGLVYRELGRYDEALAAFASVLADPASTPDVAARTTREQETLLQRVALVEITTTPVGASITLDGRDVGTTPLARKLAVPSGTHTIGARSPTRQLESRQITVAAGDATAVEITFPAELAEPLAELDRPIVLENPPIDRVKPSSSNMGPLTFGAWTAALAEARTVDATTSPVVGVGVRVGPLTGGIEGVLVAWAVVPVVRLEVIKLAGLHLHAVAAVPIVLKDGDDTDPFVAGAAGLGVSVPAGPVELYGEGMVALAAEPHGTTFPIALGVRAWLR